MGKNKHQFLYKLLCCFFCYLQAKASLTDTNLELQKIFSCHSCVPLRQRPPGLVWSAAAGANYEHVMPALALQAPGGQGHAGSLLMSFPPNPHLGQHLLTVGV